jgi:CheY-like chemotaxis protein
LKGDRLASTKVIHTYLSRSYIATLANVHQDNLLYYFKQIKSYYLNTKSNEKYQAGVSLPDAGNTKHTPIEEKNRILIVDDELDIARLFKLGLERGGGFEVDVYNDPITALSNYRPGIYDLLLLDIKMPKMSGLELYQKVKEKYKGEKGMVKVCFITAFEEYYNEFQRLFPGLETDCFIRKPISIDKLVEVVKMKLGYL